MTAEPIDWMNPPSQGWTYEQVKRIDVPFEWDLVDGGLVVRGQTNFWHDLVRTRLDRALHQALVVPYEVMTERCVLIDEYNTTKPDVVVFDKADLDIFELDCLPVRSVALMVEVVSPGSRADDRFRKPGQYAEMGVPSYWRVERDADDLPVVHEFCRDADSGVYLPVAVHEGLLRVELPFPVEVDLKRVVEL